MLELFITDWRKDMGTCWRWQVVVKGGSCGGNSMHPEPRAGLPRPALSDVLLEAYGKALNSHCAPA